MKAISEKKRVVAANAWGRDSVTYQQTFEVEESDVGRPMGDFGGHGYRSHQFSRADVGRHLIMYTHPQVQSDRRSYRFWSFTEKGV